jgi:hypothetical protein
MRGELLTTKIHTYQRAKSRSNLNLKLIQICCRAASLKNEGSRLNLWPAG